MKQLFSLLVTIGLASLISVEAGLYRFKLYPNSDCTKDYTPGGGIPIIEPIDAPVAKAQKNAIAFLAGKLGPASALGKELVNGAKTFLKIFEKVAPKLVSGLGIFAASMGVLGSLTKPTAQDLLNAVNKGFEKLADDINDRMNKMEGYVNGRVIQQETRMIKNQLQSIERHWTNCIDQSSRENSIECQRSSIRDIHADLPHFMILDEYFEGDKKDEQLEYFDVHRLEAVLIPFRDFASYHIYSLQMLVDELSDFNDTDSVFYEKKYLQQIVDHGKDYYNYAQWAYNTIFKRLVTDNNDYTNIEFNDMTDHREGAWPGVHTYSKQTVFPKCSKDTQSPINKCEVVMVIRADGKKPSGYEVFNILSVNPVYGRFGYINRKLDKALLKVGNHLAKEKCSNYWKIMKRDLPNFWKPQLLDVADSWKEAAESAEEQLKEF